MVIDEQKTIAKNHPHYFQYISTPVLLQVVHLYFQLAERERVSKLTYKAKSVVCSDLSWLCIAFKSQEQMSFLFSLKKPWLWGNMHKEIEAIQQCHLSIIRFAPVICRWFFFQGILTGPDKKMKLVKNTWNMTQKWLAFFISVLFGQMQKKLETTFF